MVASTLDELNEGDAMDAAETERVALELDLPGDLARLAFPEALDRRLHALLDRQDQDEDLSDDERAEAEGLVNLAELLTLLRLRATREGAQPTP